MTKYMYFLPLKIPRLNVLVLLISRSSGASRTCVVSINTSSSPHPAESATVLGERRPGACAPHIRRETRNSCERTTREDTELRRRSALLRTVSNTAVTSKKLVQFAFAFARTVPAHTGTRVTINTSTPAHTQGTNIDHLCVW